MKTKLLYLVICFAMLLQANTYANEAHFKTVKTTVNNLSLNLTNPNFDSVVITNGNSVAISANLTDNSTVVSASFQVYFNNNLVTSGSSASVFETTLQNITENGIVTVTASPENSSEEVSKSFEVIVTPNVIEETLPQGLKNGINYTSNTTATLVIDVPEKEFVYVAGSFNNYQRNTSYLMKKDPNSDKFWIELTGLNAGEKYTYQYWVYDTNPITNSVFEVKVADPYSEVVLTPFDDTEISESTFPNLTAYPQGQQHEVTVLQTAQETYNWQVTNFDKPKIEDLIVYEVLVRDFDSGRNFQNLIDRINYFKNLKINAIELMPVMEFKGNESWGYNTNFHMAIDKYYGTKNKLKEFVDLCHQNGIAVILDINFDYVSDNNPLVRLWQNDADNDGIGNPASNNPYFNETPMHAESEGHDFNHSQNLTKQYTKDVINYWLTEFKIDGLRWENTKGFTQNCSANDSSCTAQLQTDRIATLKDYANYSWSVDNDSYVIFDYIGSFSEEKQYADHRFSEGKGIMVWGDMSDSFHQLAKGFAGNANIQGIGHESRNFNGKRLLGFAESHECERMVYKSLNEGNTGNPDHIVQELEIALSRMSAIGAASLMVPGPKMMWHFAELGMEDSLYTCENETVDEESCMDATKPQPQWEENWLQDDSRKKIYDDWARLVDLKINEPVFEGDYTISNYINNARPRIYISDNSLPENELSEVVILCNFTAIELTIQGNFPSTGTWYDLMDETGNTTLEVNTPGKYVFVHAGQFRIFGNKQPNETLSNTTFNKPSFKIHPNPTNSSFSIDKTVENVKVIDVTGKLVKEFKGEFLKSYMFDISDLPQNMYIVQITNNQGAQETTKLIKL